MSEQPDAAAKLRRYRDKRDFESTAEPSGPDETGDREGKSPRPVYQGENNDRLPEFVIQRHRARRLHYDFRLEIAGVLVSWAVPKGPSLDSSVRHLAVHVEDHPLDYAAFEGTIPKGEYGGGDVIVWDRGTYRVHGPMPEGFVEGDRRWIEDAAAQQVADGELHLEMFGAKLSGHFMLIRTGRDGDDTQWLIFHKKDDAVKGWSPEDHPRSVLSGRTNDDIVEGGLPQISEALAALDELGNDGTWQYAGRELQLTNLNKVLFPPVEGAKGADAEPLTKRDLVRHYASVAPLLVPLLRLRPVNLHRFPNGVDNKGFWNKAVPQYVPDWITRWDNPAADEGETETYFVASEPATIAWLANYGAIELHPWTSTTRHPDRPSFAIIDLDPGEKTTWSQLLDLARLHREALKHLGVQGFPTVSGQRGIQIRVPVSEPMTFPETRDWVEDISRAVGKIRPELVSWAWNVKERHGLARLDYTQNAVNKTIVAPYSVRPRPGAPVATPIRWEELDDPRLVPNRWNSRNIWKRLEEVGDLFAPALEVRQNLPELR